MPKVIVHTDGGSRGNPGESAIGIVVEGNEVGIMKLIWQRGQYVGKHTNNEAEYLALKEALIWMVDFFKDEDHLNGYDQVEFKLDSKLVVEQMSGNWKIKDMRMRILKEECDKYLAEIPFEKISFIHIPREENKEADALVNQALDLYLENK